MGNPSGLKGSIKHQNPGDYRKPPCISHTFFHKIEAKNQGPCGLSMDTSVFGVLKNLINIHKTS